MKRWALRTLSLASITMLIIVLLMWADSVAFDAHGMVGIAPGKLAPGKPAVLLKYERGAFSAQWWNTSPWLQAPPAGRAAQYLNLQNAFVWRWAAEAAPGGFIVRCPLWFMALAFAALPGGRAIAARRCLRPPDQENRPAPH